VRAGGRLHTKGYIPRDGRKRKLKTERREQGGWPTKGRGRAVKPTDQTKEW
jgi:hypothetical protein